MAVTDIYQLADDAFQNAFDLDFTQLSSIATRLGLSLPSTQPKLRITEFSKPEKGYDTYEVHYGPLKIAKPSGKSNFSNEFSFSIRLDREYAWYKFFEAWASAVVNNYTGIVYTDSGNVGDDGNLRSNILVKPHNGDLTINDVEGDIWTIYGAMPKVSPAISYDQSSGDPIVVEINFTCLSMGDLGEQI